MRISDIELATVQFTAVSPQDSNTVPAEWQSTLPTVRSQKRVLQALIRPLGNNPLNTRKSVELVSPVVRTADGLTTVIGVNRLEVRMTTIGDSTEAEIEADLDLLIASLSDPQITSVLINGSKLI